jgi:acetyl-CoA synthetase
MLDSKGRVLVTDADLRERVPAEELPDLEHIILTGSRPPLPDRHELSWDAAMQQSSDELEPAWVDAEAPLFLIYTSGPDGHPVGLLHPHDAMRGYLMTARWVLDLKQGDVLWTHARSGWLMNIVYSAFAPWLCGVTSFVTDHAHSAEEIYGHIARQRVSILYITPRKYRLLVDAGEETARRFDLTSIRHLLSVLEQLNPDVIYAMMRILGVPVYDTWWTAETGMITIANFPCLPIKPGYLGKPFPGLQTAVLDAEGLQAPPFTMGEVGLRPGWPAMVRGIWGNERLYRRYLERQSWFMTGDTAFVDQDGYFFYQGRADDVIITSAGRVHIAEIEKALARHPAVAEAGVIRVPEVERTKRIKAYVALKAGYQPSPMLKGKIMAYVRNSLSPDIVPWDIEFRASLPKSSSGAILRRVLKAWDLGLPTGNISALADE